MKVEIRLYNKASIFGWKMEVIYFLDKYVIPHYSIIQPLSYFKPIYIINHIRTWAFESRLVSNLLIELAPSQGLRF